MVARPVNLLSACRHLVKVVPWGLNICALLQKCLTFLNLSVLRLSSLKPGVDQNIIIAIVYFITGIFPCCFSTGCLPDWFYFISKSSFSPNWRVTQTANEILACDWYGLCFARIVCLLRSAARLSCIRTESIYSACPDYFHQSMRCVKIKPRMEACYSCPDCAGHRQCRPYRGNTYIKHGKNCKCNISSSRCTLRRVLTEYLLLLLVGWYFESGQPGPETV